ncbi:hypothetical protein [Sphaerothrix gracilis]
MRNVLKSDQIYLFNLIGSGHGLGDKLDWLTTAIAAYAVAERFAGTV